MRLHMMCQNILTPVTYLNAEEIFLQTLRVIQKSVHGHSKGKILYGDVGPSNQT